MAVFINVKLEVELLQLEGSLVFGCQRDASYISFQETPYTSFSVNSEIGSKFKVGLPLFFHLLLIFRLHAPPFYHHTLLIALTTSHFLLPPYPPPSPCSCETCPSCPST